MVVGGYRYGRYVYFGGNVYFGSRYAVDDRYDLYADGFGICRGIYRDRQDSVASLLSPRTHIDIYISRTSFRNLFL